MCTTYFRDAETGLDYAVNRYSKPGEGRFMTPDPYLASGGPGDPGSWNRYTYTGGDPVNRGDPHGLDWVNVGGGWCSTLDPNGGCYDPTYGDPTWNIDVWGTNPHVCLEYFSMGLTRPECMALFLPLAPYYGPQQPTQPQYDCTIEIFYRPTNAPFDIQLPNHVIIRITVDGRVTTYEGEADPTVSLGAVAWCAYVTTHGGNIQSACTTSSLITGTTTNNPNGVGGLG